MMNFYVKRHNFQTLNKLRKLHSKKPKEFWRLLNKLDDTLTDKKIKIEELYEYFKNINAGVNDEQDDTQINVQNHDEILNSPITTEEIKKMY